MSRRLVNRRLVAAAILAYACDAPSLSDRALPSVHLVAPGGDRPEYTEGARAWEPLGFEVDRDPPIVECGRRWYESGAFECTITIGVVVDPLLVERTGSSAAASREFRTVYLDDSLAEPTRAVAHEVGHIVLDTPRHTQGGVMGGASTVLRDVDYELACETIGVCR